MTNIQDTLRRQMASDDRAWIEVDKEVLKTLLNQLDTAREQYDTLNATPASRVERPPMI